MINFTDLDIAMRLYFGVLIFALGAVFGSFCNAWAWRIVNHENIAKGRSHCATCGHTLAAKDLVPIFSYLFLRGRCRYCGERIAPRYVIAEIISASYFLSVLIVKGLSLTALRLFVLGFLLLLGSLVDLDIMELPDGIMIAGAAISLLRFLEGVSWQSYLLGLVPGAALLLVVLIMDKLMGKETMGGGDIKLVLVLGLNFGVLGAVFIIMAACIIGLIAAAINKTGKGKAFPFGPMLALATWVMILAGDKAIAAYLSLF